MVVKIYTCIILWMLCWSFGCRPAKDFPHAYKGDQIHFGQGGGISGILQYYVLLDDGRLFQRAFRDSTFARVETWPRDFTTQMFFNYFSLHLDQVHHYEPGDRYYFIQFVSGGTPVNRIAWGKPGFRPDETTVTYYNLLFKSTKPKT